MKNSFFDEYKQMFVEEFKGYNAGKLLKDILAGLTVAAVALPLAIAFGAASVGENYASIGIMAGLITAILAGIITGLTGGASFQISGPTGAMTVVLGGIVAGEYGLNGMFTACLIAGIILFVAGIINLGKLISFIPKSVITGFTSGIAIVIAIGQFGNFFGISVSGETTFDKITCFVETPVNDVNLSALICSVLVTIFLFLYPKKWSRYVPGSLVAIIIATIVVALIPNPNVKLIGDIPASLLNEVRLDFSDFSFEMLGSVISPAITIALLGMVESLLCGTCAQNMTKKPFNARAELVAQGLGNMIVPFFGGVPSTAAIARTSVAVRSGCQTRLTSVFQSLFLIVCMFVLSPLIALVPYPAIAGVLVATAWRMNEWGEIKSFFKHKQTESIILFLVTMFSTVLLDLTYAILIGVGLAFVIMIVKQSLTKPIVKDTGEFTAMVLPKGSLFFANVKKLFDVVNNIEKKSITIDLSRVTYIDASACAEIKEQIESLKFLNKELVFVCADDDVKKIFDFYEIKTDIIYK